MDINKRTIVICLLIIVICCFFTIVEYFIGGSPLEQSGFDKGVSQMTPNPSNMYFNEMSKDAINLILAKITNYGLKLSTKDTTWQVRDSGYLNENFKHVSSVYIVNAINNSLPLNESKYKITRSVLESVDAFEDMIRCIIFMTIHRESKQYGFSIRAEVVIKNNDVEGIIEAKALGIVSEDNIVLEEGYDRVIKYDNAVNIQHTILKSEEYENGVLKGQADALFKDRGIKSLKL